MKKNGFTLMELLGVIVILAIIVIAVTPVIQGEMRKSQNTLYEGQLDNIKNAAKNWAVDHPELLPSNPSEGTYRVLLSVLQDGGYIADDIKNPITKKEFSKSNTYVSISYVSENKLNYVVTVGE